MGQHLGAFMESQVRRLIISQAVVLVFAVGVGFLWKGLSGSLSIGAGFLSFSVPLTVFSILVLRASGQDPQKFWGRFMLAEVLKWAFSALFLAVSFASALFDPVPLLTGFFVSVLVQLGYPILAKRGSES